MTDFFQDLGWPDWAERIAEHGANILIVLAAAWVALLVLRHAIEPTVRRVVASEMAGQPDAELQKRMETLTHVIYRTLWVAVLVIAILMILPELGINIGPLLAGAGVAGIAIGFGAQSVVRDTINGLFILLENQYGKGDVVSLAGVSGLVEDVNLRRTVLRDLDGAVHSIPNGEIKTSSNLTRQWSRVNLNVTVTYAEDVERVMGVIDRVGRELAADETFGPMIIEPPKALRIDGFRDLGVDIKILGDTQPMKQWDVMGELRKRLKRAFDEEGIELATVLRVPKDAHGRPIGEP